MPAECSFSSSGKRLPRSRSSQTQARPVRPTYSVPDPASGVRLLNRGSTSSGSRWSQRATTSANESPSRRSTPSTYRACGSRWPSLTMLTLTPWTVITGASARATSSRTAASSSRELADSETSRRRRNFSSAVRTATAMARDCSGGAALVRLQPLHEVLVISRRRLATSIALAVVAASVLSVRLSHPQLHVDEITYMSSVLESMSQDSVLPVNGDGSPFVNKPPLALWLIRL